MFEQALEDMTAIVYIDDKGAVACSENGLSLQRGPRLFTYQEAVDIITRGEALWASAPKYQQKRFRATLNSIRNAFGPEFWERHP